MKKLILSILLLALLLTVLSTAGVNANSAIFGGNRIIYLNADPNRPQAESLFRDINEPRPESLFRDINEPQAEGI